MPAEMPGFQLALNQSEKVRQEVTYEVEETENRGP